ncbi:MAG: sodium:solute symporter [Flavobacteriales bacterium]
MVHRSFRYDRDFLIGYFAGYFVIAYILMPLYYRMNLTSIYTYLENRFGKSAYKTGASFFILSRVIGASIRLFLVANVLQLFVFSRWNVPFEVTVVISILLIWLYTYRGGIKTIIWTDTLQTLSMLTAVGVTIYYITTSLSPDEGVVSLISKSDYSDMFNFKDIKGRGHFIKQFIGGMLITITMTGMDQDMMQKNLSCKNIKDAQKNMISFSVILIFVNLLFLALGALMFIYSHEQGLDLPEKADNVYPFIALDGNLPLIVGILFLLGLLSAAYSSADSALTSLTTSVCVDIIGLKKIEEKKRMAIRKRVHVIMCIILLISIIIFNYFTEKSALMELLQLATYTYGPLLGMFMFGIFTSYSVKDSAIPFICILSPILSYFITTYSQQLLFGYQFGFELLLVNGGLTFLGLFLLREGSSQ